MTTSRAAQLFAGLAAVEQRIVAACAQAGRARSEITLVAVSKTWPASDVALVHQLGVREVAENKDQEAVSKAAQLRHLGGLRWHFVGQVQTNKARSLATYVDVVHALDRPRLARALSAAAVESGRTVEVLIQVSLDGDPERGGVGAAGVTALADLAAALPALQLGGVMAIAPQAAEPRSAFDELVRIAHVLRLRHPNAVVISAGMSADLEAAVLAGATHLRVGTALFGHRSALLR